MSINISNGLFLSEMSTGSDIFYFGGEPLISSDLTWPVSANGNSMNHVFTLSTSIINKHTSLVFPKNKIVSIFSDNSYIGDLCESPEVVRKHFSKILLSDQDSPYPTPDDINMYPKRHLNIKSNQNGSFIGGQPLWLQEPNNLEDYTFLFQFEGTEITESIGERVDQKNSWYFTNNIFEDSMLYIFIDNDIQQEESVGSFFLQMT